MRKIKWTLDTCRLEALKYNTRGEFSKAKGWAYQSALKNGWLNDICNHMEIIGNFKKRCIYVYEFPNNYAYIGLTFNFKKRWDKRLLDNNDVVTLFIKQTGLTPNKIQLSDYITEKEAIKLESLYVKKYKSNGWLILNRVKTGSLGGNIIKWTFNKCKIEALKYNTFIEFRNNNNNCLSAIYKNNWNCELLSHLKYDKKPNGYWSEEACYKKALLCKTKTEFYKKYRGAYASAKLNNWFDKVCKHMK